MTGCEDPSGLAYSESADVLLSVCANMMVKVLDARNGTEYATVPVGQGADAVIYDAGTHRAYIPAAVDGLLTVLEVKGLHDVQGLEQVPTQIGTRTGAIRVAEQAGLAGSTARHGAASGDAAKIDSRP